MLEHVDAGYGLLSGEEVAIAAPADGAVERTVAEGNRVRKGNAVFSVNDVIAYTNNAGRVSYQIDGLEGITDLATVCGINLEERYATQSSSEEQPVSYTHLDVYKRQLLPCTILTAVLPRWVWA